MGEESKNFESRKIFPKFFLMSWPCDGIRTIRSYGRSWHTLISPIYASTHPKPGVKYYGISFQIFIPNLSVTCHLLSVPLTQLHFFLSFHAMKSIERMNTTLTPKLPHS
jgi:hypothetical protein